MLQTVAITLTLGITMEATVPTMAIPGRITAESLSWAEAITVDTMEGIISQAAASDGAGDMAGAEEVDSMVAEAATAAGAVTEGVEAMGAAVAGVDRCRRVARNPP